MIYLIDDNRTNQRQNNYNITFVEEGVFDGYLTSIEKLEKREDYSDVSNLEFLKNADCILLHSTTEDYDSAKGFLPSSKTNAMKIKEIISKEGETIPLVLFSNSMGDPQFEFESNPNFIREINKNLFYKRLYDFLDDYKNSGKIELRILAWGKNFKTEQVSKLAYEILKNLAMKNSEDNLNITDLSPFLKSFRLFIELVMPNVKYNDILIDLEDKPITINEFRKKIKKINESFDKYGKNIHPWT